MVTNENSSVSVLHLLHRAGQCADELFAGSIGDSALTPRQYEVLKAVSSKQDPSQTLLVEMTGIDRSTLADIVRRMVERGLLVRSRTRRDARTYEVKLTDQGKEVLKSAEPAVRATNERLLADLAHGERDEVIRALSRIIAAASAEHPEE